MANQIDYDIIIAGGGVGGLVSAAALTQLGFSVMVLERRINVINAESGADLALWPGAITILKQLGIRPSFFESECCPLKTVHMCKLDFHTFNFSKNENIGASASILKTINMENVTKDTNENFVLVSRKALMNALQDIVASDKILYNATLKHCEQLDDYVSVTYLHNHIEANPITSRIVIGADGSRSYIRSCMYPNLKDSESIRFCGEICYRGILDVEKLNQQIQQTDNLDITTANIFPDKPNENTMRINYGSGLRSSFGYMSSDGNIAYWWVKQLVDKMPNDRGKQKECTWPEPLKTLHDFTPDENIYVHGIEDSVTLAKWSSSRLVVIGDAAHVVTPNMGQGACLAIEDGFVLAVELSSYWNEVDGIKKSFERYENCRKKYAENVAEESRKQLFIGQWQNVIAVRIREILLRLIPTSVLERNLQQNNFDVSSFLIRYRHGVQVEST